MALPTGKIGAILAALQNAGVEVEIIGAGGPGSGPFNTKEELIDFLRNNPKDPTGPAQETAAPEHTPTASELAMLSTLSKGLGELHAHLCPRIKTAQKSIEEVDLRSLRRDTQMRDLITNLDERLALMVQQIERQKGEILELGEIVRKQVGLLHRRVTKRKVEIATKSTKRTRGPKGQSVSTTG